MAETVSTEEEKQALQSEGAVQREGEETPAKEPDFCLESIPQNFRCMFHALSAYCLMVFKC